MLRENLYGVEGQKYLRDDHYRQKFKYPSEFQGDTVATTNGKNEVVNGEKSELKTNSVVELIKKSGQITVDEKAVSKEAA